MMMRLCSASLVILLAGGGLVAAPAAGEITPVGETVDAARFAFRAHTPSVSLTPAEDWFSLSIEGFGVRARSAGAPDIPTRIVRVAIPPGVTPSLIVRASEESLRPGARPRPVPRERVDFSESVEAGSGDVRPARVERRPAYVQNGAIYAGREPYPARLAWLGEIGTLRDQRYVEVHLAPVRFDPEIGGLKIAQALDVEVVFEGWDPTLATPAEDPRFESLYRKAFVNYEQGRSFRVSATGSSGDVSLAGSEGGAVDSPTARQRIRIRANGVVRLDHAKMAATDFITEPLSTWKLSSRGVEVPLDVRDDDGDGLPEATDGNDLLDPGEWVQFYGQALDFDPKTALNTSLNGIELWEYLDASDENVYFLTVEPGPRSRVATRDALPPHTLTPPASFTTVARAEVDDAWRPLGGADPWYWSPTLFQPGTSSRTDIVSLPGLASTTADLRVRVYLQGRSEYSGVFPDHETLVTLRNGTSQVLTTDGDDGTFDGLELFEHDFTWTYSGGAQASQNVRVQLDALPTAAASNDVILDRIEIEYGRTFAASGDTLTFEWPDSDAEFVVSGLTSPAPHVYEITDDVASSGVIDAVRLLAVEITGAGPYSARFRIDDTASGNPRRFVVAGSGALTVPTGSDFTTDTVSDLRNTAIQADLIVIAHRDLLDDPANCADSELSQLLALRASRGVSSKVACIDDVEDEFNDGVPGPLAIRNFLAWVLSGAGWADPKPSYVLLLGDSSYDYKAGTANGTYVPTQIMFKEDPSIGYYASDNVLAAVVGTDQLADVTIGRLSVRTETEADDILNKVRLYEQSPAGGNWLGNALLVSDRGKAFDAFEAEEFERINAIGAADVTAAGLTARSMEYWSDPLYCDATPGPGCSPGAFRLALKANVNGDDPAFDGAAMMQFSGHGNFDAWSDDALFCVDETKSYCPADDTLDLDNGSRLPWLIVHNCLTGGFHSTALKSFGESWTKHGVGGAIAVLAPSGLGFRFIGEVVTGRVWEDVYGPTKERDLGMIALSNQEMLCGQNSIEACQYYVLLGDPSARLAIPAPAPPSNLEAVAGNGVVGLSWTASVEETLHNVYRSTQPGSGYTKHPGSPVTCSLGGTCTFDDTTVINANTYYYYVVARDADDFESTRSNFNGDCATNGPDCVSAHPVNPNPPPPPASVTVTDPETGGRLDVSWPVAAQDVFSYTVHYGTTSGVYTGSQTVGLNLQATITGLQNGTTYFVAVKATNTSGHTSGFSPEDSEKPTFVQGLRAPAWIGDLRLSKSGNDAVLSWSAVTQDIYERPKTIAFYEVYRGTSVQFVPAPGNRIAPSVVGTTFTDVGALTPGGPAYYYLVRAVDADDSGGGLGGQLPNGINDLAVDRAGTCSITTTTVCRATSECPGGESCQLSPTNLLLSWSAVATDFDNDPTQIDHYEVYARATPFTRADVRDGLVQLLISVAGTSTGVVPTAEKQYYSVIAVDPRDNKSPF